MHQPDAACRPLKRASLTAQLYTHTDTHTQFLRQEIWTWTYCCIWINYVRCNNACGYINTVYLLVYSIQADILCRQYLECVFKYSSKKQQVGERENKLVVQHSWCWIIGTGEFTILGSSLFHLCFLKFFLCKKLKKWKH